MHFKRDNLVKLYRYEQSFELIIHQDNYPKKFDIHCAAYEFESLVNLDSFFLFFSMSGAVHKRRRKFGGGKGQNLTDTSKGMLTGERVGRGCQKIGNNCHGFYGWSPLLDIARTAKKKKVQFAQVF